MKFNKQVIAVGIAASMVIGSAAVADVAPPDDYVETCTLENQHYDDTECFVCENSPMYGNEDGGVQDPDVCKGEEAYGSQGYEKKCQTRGASFWQEIWCRSAPGAEGPADDDESSCSVTTIGHSTPSTLSIGLVMAMLFIGLFSLRKK